MIIMFVEVEVGGTVPLGLQKCEEDEGELVVSNNFNREAASSRDKKDERRDRKHSA